MTWTRSDWLQVESSKLNEFKSSVTSEGLTDGCLGATSILKVEMIAPKKSVHAKQKIKVSWDVCPRERLRFVRSGDWEAVGDDAGVEVLLDWGDRRSSFTKTEWAEFEG